MFFTDLSEVDVNTFLGPFLDVIRSEDTTGPITGIALASVNKFLSYGLIGNSTSFIHSHADLFILSNCHTSTHLVNDSFFLNPFFHSFHIYIVCFRPNK